MKVLCYVDENAEDGGCCYCATPADAAALFAHECGGEGSDTIDVVTTPADEDAFALAGWTLRPDGARVRLFRVAVRWVPEEVQSFAAEAGR